MKAKESAPFQKDKISSTFTIPKKGGKAIQVSNRKIKSKPTQIFESASLPSLFCISLLTSSRLPTVSMRAVDSFLFLLLRSSPHYDDLLFSPRLIDHVERARELPSRVDPGPPLGRLPVLQGAASAGLCACQRFCLTKFS